MKKKFTVLACCGLILFSCCGCFALFAGAAGGAGTAVWLSGKLTQEVNVSFDSAVRGAKRALESLRLDIEKETKKDNVAQLISKYSDGKTIWVDIHKVSNSKSRISVRVGAITNEAATREIFDRILKSL